MKKTTVTINNDYDDWKIKGLLAEVLYWDGDKKFGVKLLEKSQTPYLNIGDVIWLKPMWLDGIWDNGRKKLNVLYKLPAHENDTRTKKERYRDYKNRSKRYKMEFELQINNGEWKKVSRKQIINQMHILKDTQDDFCVRIDFETKWSSMSGCLVECDESGYTLQRNFIEVERKIKNFQQRIGRILEGRGK